MQNIVREASIDWISVSRSSEGEADHMQHTNAKTSRLSPYLSFTRDEWATLRETQPLTLSARDVEELRGLGDRVSLTEVEEVYLPLARLLHLYVRATEKLYEATNRFLGASEAKVPFIIGIGGSVAVGKSTTARLIRALLERGPLNPKVDLVTTDGFLFPNRILEERGIMHRKGFPESYDVKALLSFLYDVKSGKGRVIAPVYSHLVYDIVQGQEIVVEHPDILILEGLNVLQTGSSGPLKSKPALFVSDFFDFSIYVDAPEDYVRRWYVERFHALRETAFRKPESYFHRYASLTDERAEQEALGIWERINGLNLRQNILPTRERADLILEKRADHAVERVRLRKL